MLPSEHSDRAKLCTRLRLFLDGNPVPLLLLLLLLLLRVPLSSGSPILSDSIA
jgi:hypothetical protein